MYHLELLFLFFIFFNKPFLTVLSCFATNKKRTSVHLFVANLQTMQLDVYIGLLGNIAVN